MNWLLNRLINKRLFQGDLNLHLVRASMVIATDTDRLLGFMNFGVGAGEVMSAVQIAMMGGLHYIALRDAVLAHPTFVEGLQQ